MNFDAFDIGILFIIGFVGLVLVAARPKLFGIAKDLKAIRSQLEASSKTEETRKTDVRAELKKMNAQHGPAASSSAKR